MVFAFKYFYFADFHLFIESTVMGVYSSSFVGDPRGAHGVQSYCHPSNSNWITAHAISTERVFLLCVDYQFQVVFVFNVTQPFSK